MTVEARGPVLNEGPVEIVLEDGTVARSDRFMVAVCTCCRTYPWCDTSPRPRQRGTPAPGEISSGRAAPFSWSAARSGSFPGPLCPTYTASKPRTRRPVRPPRARQRRRRRGRFRRLGGA
ncbi:CDGSH iron-sulfur domain-containing protein [Streptomyces sp. NBC_00354]|uniref:CDGSH iron-sulfur domain-containing protein n=1 Tax=Streptomyces sp. NBC_00354 TaxID=2975723 RepID=UPI002E26E131